MDKGDGINTNKKLVRVVAPCRTLRFLAAALASWAVLLAGPALAETWSATPSSSDWNTAVNWVEGTVPNGASSIAQFGLSSPTPSLVTVGNAISVDTLLLGIDADTYIFEIGASGQLLLQGAGIENLSATAAQLDVLNGGVLAFDANASAANSLIYNDAGNVYFFSDSTASDAEISSVNGARTQFYNDSSAGSAQLISSLGSVTEFLGSSTGGSATVTANNGGRTIFYDTASAGSAYVLTGSSGSAEFLGSSTAGSARVNTQAGGIFDITGLSSGGLTAGSIEGAGQYRLGSNNLQTGSLGTSTQVSGVISGAGGSLTKIGTGTLTLTGVNTYSGGTTIADGTVAIVSDGNLGDAAGGITFDAGTLQMLTSLTSARDIVLDLGGGTVQSSTGTTTLSGSISGVGALNKTGTGTLVLTGANTYIGGTTVTAGTLRGNSTSLQGDIVNDASVTFDQVTDGTYAGDMSGIGALTKQGSGTLRITGANTYSGSTTIDGGTIEVEGGITGTNTFSIRGNGMLRVTGASSSVTVSNNVTVGGSNAGTMLIENGASVQNSLGSVGSIAGGSVTVTGAGSLWNNTAGFVLAGSGSGNSGIITVADGGEIRAYNGSGSGTVYLGFGTGSTATLNIGTGAGAGIISTDLVRANNGTGTVNFNHNEASYTFAPRMTNALQVNHVGSGTTILTGNNSYTGGTRIDSGTLAISSNQNLGDAAGVVSFGGGTLRTDASFTSARTITLDAGGGAIDTNGFQLGVSGTIQGAGGLTKAGAGRLTLSGTNTYAGGTTLSGGTVSISADANLGDSAGALTFSGGTLETTAALSTTRNVVLTGAGTIDTGAFNVLLSGELSGSGALTKMGAGTLSLSGANTYSGGTTVIAGALQGSSTSLQGNIVNDATVIFDQAADGAYSGAMSGTGALTKTGSGVLTLNGVNGYSGGTTISAGALRGDSSSIQGDVVNNASAIFDQVSDGTYGGTMTGSGGLAKAGGGTLVLSGANSYAGGTTVAAGTLQGNSISLQGNIVNDAAVIFDQVTEGTYAGVMSGTGTLTKTGTGVLTLSSANSYSGGTTISAGALRGDSLSMQGDIVNNAAAIFDQASDGAYAGNMTGSGSLIKSGAGTLTLSGANTYSGGTRVDAGALSISADRNLGDLAGGLAFNGGTLQTTSTFAISRTATLDTAGGGFDVAAGNTLTFSGPVNGSGELRKLGAGTLILTGNNGYAGGTTIAAGTLQGDTASLRGNIRNDASLAFDQRADGASHGAISGTGSVTKSGTAALTLYGANTYSGPTLVQRGTLSVEGSLMSAVTVGSGATLGGTGAINSRVVIAGGATLAPGRPAGSIGALTIAGPLTLTAGSRLELDADAAGAVDRVQVSGPNGAAEVEGATLRIEAIGSNYQRDTTYTVLTADAGVSGRFGAASTNLTFLSPALSYDTNAVHVTLTRNDVRFRDIAATANQVAVADYLDNAAGAGGIELLIRDFDGLSAEQTRQAFESIGGEGLSSPRRAALATTVRAHEMISTRLGIGGDDGRTFRPVASNAAALRAETEQPAAGTWARVIGSSGNVADGEDASGYSWSTTGTAIGLERKLGPSMLVGASAMHTRSDIDFGADRLATSAISTPQALVYGGYTLMRDVDRLRYSSSHLQLRGILGYARHEYESLRRVEIGEISAEPSASHQAREWSAQAEIELVENLGELRLQTAFGLRYIRQEGVGYEETGGPLALAVEGSTIESVAAMVGARFVRRIFGERGLLEFRGLWSHELSDSEPTLTAALVEAHGDASFRVTGVPAMVDTFTLGASLSARIRERVFAYADYKAELWRSGRNQHSAIVGLSYLW